MLAIQVMIMAISNTGTHPEAELKAAGVRYTYRTDLHGVPFN